MSMDAIDNIDLSIVYQIISFVKIYIDRSLVATIKFNRGAYACVSPMASFSHIRQQCWIRVHKITV